MNNRYKKIIKFIQESKIFFKNPENKWKHPLVKSIFSEEDQAEAIDSILSTSVTMGSKVKLFEKNFSHWLGIKNSVMVNSGSSANLLIFFLLKYVLSNNIFDEPNRNEVILPAFTWSTTLFPIVQSGFRPVFVDCGLDDFNITPDNIEKAINNKTIAICCVHLLGSPCNMDRIVNLSREHNLYLIEDSCEAHGAEWNKNKVGNFGDLSSFSFFFSHHISTGEGGIISTDNEQFIDKIKSLRAHGWIRDKSNKESIAKKYPNIDKRFLFDEIGFNLRPTDVTAALGVNQINKLDEIIKKRRNNHFYWKEKFKNFEDLIYTIDDSEKGIISPFVFPLVIRENSKINRDEFQRYMEKKDIETRSVAAGNLLNQPFANNYKGFEKRYDLSNSDYLMDNSFFWGNSHLVTEEEREYVSKVVIDYLSNN